MSAAYFGVFWMVKRPGFQNRIGGLLGLDKDKIVAFADRKVVKREEKNLQRLEKGIIDKLQSHKTIESLTKETKRVEQKTPTADKASVTDKRAFFKRSRSGSVGELDLDSSLHRRCSLV